MFHLPQEMYRDGVAQKSLRVLLPRKRSSETPFALYVTFSRILPFLDSRDTLSLRSTCREYRHLVMRHRHRVDSPNPACFTVFQQPTHVKFFSSTLHLMPSLQDRLILVDLERCGLRPHQVPSHLPRLQRLDVGFNPIGNEGFFRALTNKNLQHLLAHHCGITAYPVLERPHTQIRHLVLQSNPIQGEDSDFFKFFPNLSTLRVDAPSPIDTCTQLLAYANKATPPSLLPRSCVELHLFRPQLECLNTYRLHSLVLHDTRGQPWDQFFAPVSFLRRLRKLVLVHCDVTSSTLVHVARHVRVLTTLSLAEMDLSTAQLLEIFGHLPRHGLHTLVARDCDQFCIVPEDDPSPLIQAMNPTRAQVVDFGRRPFISARDSLFIEKVLKSLPQLTDIGLMGRQIFFPDGKFPCTAVRRLDLSHALINFGIADCTDLETINLSGITGDVSGILRDTMSLPRLRVCVANMTYLYSPIRVLAHHRSLQVLGLAFIEGHILTTLLPLLTKVPNLKVLDMRGAAISNQLQVIPLLGVREQGMCVVDARGRLWKDESPWHELVQVCLASRTGAFERISVSTNQHRETGIDFLSLSL